MERPIGILYEHALWFEPLFAEFERREVAYEKLHAGELVFDPGERQMRHSVVLNRMSPSAWTRGRAHAIFHTLHYLAYLDEIGASVVNGHGAFQVEISKTRQCALFARLGLRYPRARVISSASRAAAAALELRFSVLVKPNVGGSGAGIRSFSGWTSWPRPQPRGNLDFGPDGTALVQEHLPAEGESIVRVEILGGEFLYAIRIRLVPGGFNLCPADYCELPGVADGVSGQGLPIERFDPPAELIDDARRLIAAAGMDLGGVEYLVSARDGLPTSRRQCALELRRERAGGGRLRPLRRPGRPRPRARAGACPGRGVSFSRTVTTSTRIPAPRRATVPFPASPGSRASRC